MSNDFDWIIAGVERTTDPRHEVRAIHWRYQLRHGDAVVDEYGDHPLPPGVGLSTDGATKADYVAVLEDALDRQTLQERLHKRLHDLLHPKTELVAGPVN
jgi:hypothetical protein